MLQILWKTKLISSEAIFEWAEAVIEDPHDMRQTFVDHCAGFIQYLKDLDEDSGEEEEEESEEDD